jgi:hypothetical protein
VTALPVSASAQPSSSLPVDARARAEIVSHALSALPATSASGTIIGTDTGREGHEPPVPEESETASLVALLPTFKPSNAGLERDLRGTLYFDLVDACRGPGGAPLPPEAVLVVFRVDPKGQIDRASVQATALDRAHAEAARCMVRVVRSSEARFTPPRTDKPIEIHAKVPSVD